MDRAIKVRKEYRVKLEKEQLDYSKMLEDEELSRDIICPKCHGEKELVMTPYWGAQRRYYTCYFVCPRCEERR
jgi:rubredoxin